MKKRVLILGPDLRLMGGVANYYRTLRLHELDNIDYFAVNDGKKSFFKKLKRLIENYFRFVRKIRLQQPDIVHVNPSLQRNSFYRDAIFIMLTKLLRKKVIVFFRGWREDYEEKVRRNFVQKTLFRISYAKADTFIVLSEQFQKKLHQMGVSPTIPFFTETTVADSTYLNELNFPLRFAQFKKEVVFLFLARVEKEKGIYIAIDAFKIFSKTHQNRRATLIIAGDGPELDRAKQYAEKNAIPNIQFTGMVTGENKKKVLLDAHILIFPSYTEGLPNTILECMVYGMPVIARSTGGIPDIIRQGENGYITDSFEPIVFSGLLEKIVFDQAKYEYMSLQNHKQAKETFTTEIVKSRILKIYHSFEMPTK